MEEMTCRNCGSTFSDKFCQHCGEKKFDRHELTIKHFFQETLESFIHFDNRFLRSLKTLLLKPGKLTLDFVEGKRVSYMKPLQLFLILNISLFIVPGNPFALPLYNYITYAPFTNYNTKDVVNEKLKKDQITLKEYNHQFDEKIKSDSKEFIFLYIPFYALIFALLFIFLKKNFAEHLVFASHFMSFYILLSIIGVVFMGIPFYLFSKVTYSQLFDNIQTAFTILAMTIYLFLAMRKFYQTSFIWSLVCSGSIAFTFFIFIQYYRMLLFYKIIYFN